MENVFLFVSTIYPTDLIYISSQFSKAFWHMFREKFSSESWQILSELTL